MFVVVVLIVNAVKHSKANKHIVKNGIDKDKFRNVFQICFFIDYICTYIYMQTIEE